MNRLKKIWHWLDDRSGFTVNFRPILTHLAPPGAKWSYVFGTATLFCFMLQVITGVGLSLLYQPSSSTAYNSLEFITNTAALGRVLRGMHYWGASAMVLMVGLHMIRVYITAAYKFPRTMAWVSGVFLLLATIAMGFTGQLLRWDANGVWSTVVAAQMVGRVPFIGKDLAHFMLGGTTIGGQTLSRFYAYHVFVLPAIIFLFVGYHLMLVLHNGISEPPKAGRLVDPKTYRQWYADMLKKEGVPFWPNAAWRDVTFSTAVIVIIILLAIFVGPPHLTKPPNPSSIDAAPRPDWYLLWIFAIMALMPRSIESYAMFLGPLIVIIVLFALPFISRKGERSPIRRPWAIFGTLCVVVAVLAFWAAGEAANWSPDFKTKPLPASAINSNNPEVQQGAHLFYIKGCQFCHHMDGHGGRKGPDLSSIGSTLTTQEMKIRIVNGGKEMPGYGTILTKKELEEIIAFLETRK